MLMTLIERFLCPMFPALFRYTLIDTSAERSQCQLNRFYEAI